MAKTKKAPSLHSRAARRAASPSLNLDKSITTAPRAHSPTRTSLTTPASETITRKVLDAVHRTLAASSAGVRKPESSGTGPVKRGQRSKVQKLRREAGKERAAAVAEMLVRKELDSRKKGVVIRDRRGQWDAVNARLPTAADGELESAGRNPFAALVGSE
ncbi:hypothetical protein DRE_01817 [Drechslerella stenobrocha 248]|uniref:Uncharacterized protein n=1 Tax=Drechslerella stenobrocha 248 TaxID=1043628 RepID=W7IH76_9PEZI|nr:hypothetical protein DRE_01817 [Drechslerella stenobrocha 248]